MVIRQDIALLADDHARTHGALGLALAIGVLALFTKEKTEPRVFGGSGVVGRAAGADAHHRRCCHLHRITKTHALPHHRLRQRRGALPFSVQADSRAAPFLPQALPILRPLRFERQHHKPQRQQHRDKLRE